MQILPVLSTNSENKLNNFFISNYQIKKYFGLKYKYFLKIIKENWNKFHRSSGNFSRFFHNTVNLFKFM